MLNIQDNDLKEILKQVFECGYNSPVEERDKCVESVLSRLRERQDSEKVDMVAPLAKNEAEPERQYYDEVKYEVK